MNDSDTRLRQALGDLLDTAPSAPLSPRDVVPFTAESTRRYAPVLVGALAIGAVAASGIVLASRPGDRPDSVGATSVATTAVTTPASSSPVPMSTPGTGVPMLDRLPVADSASDFYAGSVDLGEPQVATGWFDTLVRCAQLTTDGLACARLEGIAGDNLVSYEPGAVTIDTVARNIGSYSVRVGTTFTEVTPTAYVSQWSSGPVATAETTSVRGHAATRFEHEGSPAVVWQERPGVLVWVAVPPEQADQLLTVAEGVRRVDGPTTIPDIVVVTPLSTSWDAGNNNADGLIAARSGGAECVGLDYIDGTCGESIGQRTIVRHWSDPEMTLVAGSTPANVVSVRIETSEGATASMDTVAFGTFASRFYSTSVAKADTITITWLDADGAEVDHTSVTPGRPDVEVDTTVPRDVVLARLDAWRHRVEVLLSERLGFRVDANSTDTAGVTTVTAADGDRTIVITATPGSPSSEKSERGLVTTAEKSADRIRLEYVSNDGWRFTLVAERTGTTPLPGDDDLGGLISSIG